MKKLVLYKGSSTVATFKCKECAIYEMRRLMYAIRVGKNNG